ncbi:MAG: antitoxin Xre/MbcA/ParS toxin-binding domain-containing protein [Bacteroidota bacterium]
MTEKKYSFEHNQSELQDAEALYSAQNSSLQLITHLLGGVNTLGVKVNNMLEFLQLTQIGLPINVLKHLQKHMKLTNRDMGKVLEISESTLQRRLKRGEKLDKRESEGTVQLAEVWAKGIEVFNDEDDFRDWLRMNNTALGNYKPIDLLHSPIGRQEIKNILTRIEWGLYS